MKDFEQTKQCKEQTLYDALTAYGQSDFYPYHMPGHKRNGLIEAMADMFQIDITEIDGFDNLHQPEGILRQAQERAAKLYGAEETFFLINGSTCGILAAVSAAADRQGSIVIARNCHKSVYHAAFLQELHTRYLYPEQITEYDIPGAVCPADVEAVLEKYPECAAVVITSPTYEGIISDIRKISGIVHEKNKILIVDEAHGAHLGLAKNMPENAIRQGADIVIHSLHKTLPSMTQTALLHVNGSRVDRKRLRRYLSIYQSSSPSYVLMSGMDACIFYMEKHAAGCFQKLEKHYGRFRKQMEQCRYIRIGNPKTLPKGKYCFAAWDICKLVISVQFANGKRMNGQLLYNMLRDEFHLQMEMAADRYVLAIMTISDEEEGWQRLADALLQIDGRIEEEAAPSQTLKPETMESAGREAQEAKCRIRQAAKMTIAEAVSAAYNGREVPLSEAAGEVIGDFINLYPPGVPLLVPGEVISEDIVGLIREYQRLGLRIQGVSDAGTVIVVSVQSFVS